MTLTTNDLDLLDTAIVSHISLLDDALKDPYNEEIEQTEKELKTFEELRNKLNKFK